MTSKAYSGVIELQFQILTECPDYASLGLRTDAGRFIEVLLPTSLVSKKPTQYQIGQRLSLAGGEWYIESDDTGVGEYVRWWPSSVMYDA